ncbi:hypothetical protein HHI36_005352 [Cryptolaemus montrouzieri]|uniref:Major facilitator superfamily (MFS) profile domain-containing protein n=1 Tax=Cryptolaemus montrouzieri TaxID=559131 RepID=A0ABD2NTV8_9CUCU
MTLGYTTLLIPVLSGNGDSEFSLGPEGISWIGSVALICVPFGCFLSGMITQPLGRKRSMQLINIPFMASWLLFYFSTKIWHVFAALALSGLAGGLMEAPVLTYVAEVTQPHLRGVLSSTSSMSVISGSMIQFILSTFLKWRTVALCSAVVPIFSFCLLYVIPETPTWLVSKKRYKEAKESLAWLRGWVEIEKVDKEYKELFAHIQMSRGIGNSGFQLDNGQMQGNVNGEINKTRNETNQNRKRTKTETLKLFKKRNFIRPYLLVSYTFFLSHFNGMSPVQTYAVTIFSSLKAPIDEYYATALLGIVEFFGCVSCVCLLRHIGKRVLSFISLIATAICFLVIGLYSYFFHINTLLENKNSNTTVSNSTVHPENVLKDSHEYSWVPLVLIISAAFVSHMGIRVLPWILTGEMFPNETRAIASGITATSYYIFGFVCNKVFLSMINTFTLPGTFWFYSSMSFIGFIVLYFILPETEGKTLQEITDHFAGKSSLGNKVYKRRKNITGINNEAFNDNTSRRTDIESKL